ncbi:MAG: hypothetical protein Q9166_003495 [cf. Caloplaca sp. 2 TL-2023]
MEANIGTRPQLALSITSAPDLTLDLWKGVSDDIRIDFRSAECVPNGEPPPFIEFVTTCIDWYKVPPPVWAFTDGPLAIRDHSGKLIDIKGDALLDFQPSVANAVQYLHGDRVNQYNLDRTSQRLLKVLRSNLRPGSSYNLGFQEKTFPMRAIVVDRARERLRAAGDNRCVNVACDSSEVLFEVVAGTPVPSFQVALSTSTVACGYGKYPNRLHYWVKLKITSLDKRSVKVKMPDPKFEMVYEGLGKWLHVFSPKMPFASKLMFQCNKAQRQSWQKDDGVVIGTCPSVLIFHEGKSYTVRCEPPCALFNGPGWKKELYMKIIADYSGFSIWKYSDEEDGRSEAPSEWPSNGRIEFEPVLDG